MPGPVGDSDEALLAAYAAASAKDRTRLSGELFARHYERVARWCYRFTGDRESAADLAQDVFLKAHRHLDSFKGSSQFSTWLYSIARNEWLSRLQREPTKAITEDIEHLADIPAPTELPSAGAERASQRRWLHQFLVETLDDTERTVFTLHFGDGVSLEDITRILKLQNPSGAKAFIVGAKRKLSRAVSRLRAKGSIP